MRNQQMSNCAKHRRGHEKGPSSACFLPTHNRRCKICFEDQDDHSLLISPCRCRGSLQFVHKTCLWSWISAPKQGRVAQIAEEIAKYTCQICKTVVACQVQKQFIWKTKDEVCNYICANNTNCLKFIITCILIFSFFAAAIIMCVVQFGHLSKSSEDRTFEVIGVLFFACCLLALAAIMLYFTIKNYFQQSQLSLGRTQMERQEKVHTEEDRLSEKEREKGEVIENE